MGLMFECWKYISDSANDDSPDAWRENVSKGEEEFIRIFNNG